MATGGGLVGLRGARVRGIDKSAGLPARIVHAEERQMPQVGLSQSEVQLQGAGGGVHPTRDISLGQVAGQLHLVQGQAPLFGLHLSLERLDGVAPDHAGLQVQQRLRLHVRPGEALSGDLQAPLQREGLGQRGDEALRLQIPQLQLGLPAGPLDFQVGLGRQADAARRRGQRALGCQIPQRTLQLQLQPQGTCHTDVARQERQLGRIQVLQLQAQIEARRHLRSLHATVHVEHRAAQAQAQAVKLQVVAGNGPHTRHEAQISAQADGQELRRLVAHSLPQAPREQQALQAQILALQIHGSFQLQRLEGPARRSCPRCRGHDEARAAVAQRELLDAQGDG